MDEDDAATAPAAAAAAADDDDDDDVVSFLCLDNGELKILLNWSQVWGTPSRCHFCHQSFIGQTS